MRREEHLLAHVDKAPLGSGAGVGLVGVHVLGLSDQPLQLAVLAQQPGGDVDRKYIWQGSTK